MSFVESQSRVLTALFATPGVHLPPAVCLYGHPSTGRCTALRAALASFPGYSVAVDCVECYSPALLYQLVWRRLERLLPPSAAGEQVAVCSVDALLRRLHDSSSALSCGLLLVLERAERLRSSGSHARGGSDLLSTLLNLQQLSGLNVCVVLVSSVVWHKFSTSSCLPVPVLLHFPQWDRAQLCRLLLQWSPAGADQQLYEHFLRALVFTLYVSCRSVSELRHAAAASWHHYTRPLRSGQIASAGNLTALWKHVEPYLRSASRQIFLRHADSASSGGGDLEQSVPVPAPSDLGRLNAELPFYSKFLLIAAFLASFNPAKTDRRFFVRSRCKQRRAKCGRRAADRGGATASGGGRDVALLAGPRAFPLHRLMAIFYFIVEDRVAPTAHLYTQLMSLVALRLLARATAADNIDTCKFRCLLGLQTTRAIASSVHFHLDRYLYDFV